MQTRILEEEERPWARLSAFSSSWFSASPWLLPERPTHRARRDVVIGMIQEPDVLNSVITATSASNFVMKAMMNFPTYYDPSYDHGLFWQSLSQSYGLL